MHSLTFLSLWSWGFVQVSGRRGGSSWEYSRGAMTLDMWGHVVGACQAFRLERQLETRSFLPLRRSLPSDWAAVQANLLPYQRDILAELSGLWTGSYGPHGRTRKRRPKMWGHRRGQRA